MRETLLDDVFLQCREGNCLEETVIGPLSVTSSNTTSSNATAVRRRLLNTSSSRVWEATNCVDGNTGPLCGLCLPGYTIQSGVCAICSPGDSFASWNGTFKSLLYAAAAVLGVLVVAVLFFQPLIPRLDKAVDAFIGFGHNAATRAKDCLKCACFRKKPEVGAAEKAQTDDAVKHETAQEPEAAPDARAMAGHTAVAGAASDEPHALRRNSAAFRGMQYSDAAKKAHTDATNYQIASAVTYTAGVASFLGGQSGGNGGGNDSDGEGGSAGGYSGDGAVDMAVNFTDDVQRALAKLQKMSKIFVCAPCGRCLRSFSHAPSVLLPTGELLPGTCAERCCCSLLYRITHSRRSHAPQIVTSFLKTLDVPWPSFFVTIMARANVINLNLGELILLGSSCSQAD